MSESKTKILTVSEISQLVSETFEKNFGSISIEGEITNVSKSGNGHIYFSLKDENALINVVCWKSKSTEITKCIKDGQYVVCSGELTIYCKSSRYQLVLFSIKSLSDEGKFLLALEKLKEKLFTEGLFAFERKKKIPRIPRKLGLITSNSGAVIEDMLNRIKARFPCEVVLYSVPVQGVHATQKIIEGLKHIDEKDCDVIIIARGGGSQDDLKCFNDESLIRFVASMNTPVVSAIGHESDWCLLDLVADLRASTPTAAIELILPMRSDIESKIVKNLQSIERWIEQKFDALKFTIKSFHDMKYFVENKIHILQVSLTKNLNYLDSVVDEKLRYSQQLIDILRVELEKYNINNILKMGFAILKQNGKIVQLKSELIVNTVFEIYFSDGIITINEVTV